MALKIFLQRLLDFGIDKDFFFVEEIKNLDKSCCEKCSIEAIDFDFTKETICKLQGLKSYKSCDALKILIKDERIDFIEMKGLKEFLRPKFPNKKNFDPSKNVDDQIKNKIESFDIINKIQESLDILKLIINSKEFQLTKDESKVFQQIIKNFIIVTDLSPDKNGLEFILASLDVLSENSSSIEKICSKIFDSEIKNSNFPNIYNIQQPIPMTCEGLSRFYS